MNRTVTSPESEIAAPGAAIVEFVRMLAARWKLLVIVPLLAGAIAAGVATVIPPTFTARTTFLPSAPAAGAGASFSALGNLAGLAGVSIGTKGPADQLLALLSSHRVADQLIDKHQLMSVYEVKQRIDARRILERNSRIGMGRKDSLITIEVDDGDPVRAAALANQYVEELRALSAQFALTEAQQRRVFFERHLSDTRTKLAKAQDALQSAGFSLGAFRAEPKSAAEAYARARAELTTNEIQLQTLRQRLAEGAPEIRQLLAAISALRAQVTSLERRVDVGTDSDYVGKYREFKYQEAVFELLARQYEAARLDESRESVLIQVVDAATPPERRTSPKRTLMVMVTVAATLGTLLVGLLIVHLWQQAATGNALAAPALKRLSEPSANTP